MDSAFIVLFEIQVILQLICCLVYISKAMYERTTKQVELAVKLLLEEQKQSQQKEEKE